MGEYLHIDEVALTNGELYTFVTNPLGKGKKGTIVALIKGTRAELIVNILDRLSLVRRKRVKSVVSDMAANMQLALRNSFPNAEIVIDKFHVIRLVLDALQAIRVKYRWHVLNLQNTQIKYCKANHIPYRPKVYSNGDTERQLLARSTYVLYKSPGKWTKKQRLRATILFKNYPVLKRMYQHTQAFRSIYEMRCPEKAIERLRDWIALTNKFKLSEFNTAANSIHNHLENIANYFKKRLTNAFAESFNAKVKRFRFNLKGVSDRIFFQYRLTKLFA